MTEHAQSQVLDEAAIPVRPFNLLRYFTLTALVAILLWSLGIGWLLNWLAQEALLTLGERHAVEVTEHLYAQLYQDVLTPLMNEGVDREMVSAAVAQSLGGFDVTRIDIYDLSGRLRYSTDETVLGRAITDDEFYLALANAKPISRLERAGAIDQQTGQPRPYDLIETYIPFYAEDGRTPVGVFEVYQKGSDLTALARRAGWMVTAAAVAGMGLLFLVLLVIVRRADRIIRDQTATLTRQNRSLRQLQQAKDDLTRMMVHDLKTPLSVIMGAVGLVRAQGSALLPPKLAKWLVRAEKSSRAMLGLIEDILDISRLGEDKIALAQDHCRADEIVLPPLEGLSDLVAEEGKELVVDVPPDLPLLEADRRLLQRVIGNLVSNALKYADSQVRVSACADQGDFCVYVIDDGPGVPPAWRERIFDKFAQVGGEQQRSGSGLGLTFCKLAVQAHGGRIWVDETEDGDTRFVFTIPYSDRARDKPSAPDTAPAR